MIPMCGSGSCIVYLQRNCIISWWHIGVGKFLLIQKQKSISIQHSLFYLLAQINCQCYKFIEQYSSTSSFVPVSPPISTKTQFDEASVASFYCCYCLRVEFSCIHVPLAAWETSMDVFFIRLPRSCLLATHSSLCWVLSAYQHALCLYVMMSVAVPCLSPHVEACSKYPRDKSPHVEECSKFPRGMSKSSQSKFNLNLEKHVENLFWWCHCLHPSPHTPFHLLYRRKWNRTRCQSHWLPISVERRDKSTQAPTARMVL